MKTGYLIRKVACVLTLYLFISTPALYSQNLQVRNYTEDDGLANSVVYDITQDNSGCMWFATKTGISSYDSTNWDIYPNMEGLPIAVYSKIKHDSRGTIWALATYPDLVIVYFEKENEKWQALPKPVPRRDGNLVTAFAVATINKQTVVAVGTEGRGLFLWSEKKWKNVKGFPPDSPAISSIINDIAAYNDTFYIAADTGFYVLKDGKIDDSLNKRIAPHLSEVIKIAIEEKNNSAGEPGGQPLIRLLGRDWIGYLEKDEFTLSKTSITIPRNDSDVFLQPDHRGGLFYGNRYGIFYFDTGSGSVRQFGKNNGLISGGAVGSYIDREQNIWLATYRGVSKISGMRFANYRRSHGLLSDETTAVLELEPGRMVFGHTEGLTYFNTEDNHFNTLELSRKNYPEETFSRVLDLCAGKKGYFWAAAADLGLAEIYRKKVTRWYGPKEGLTGQVSSVLMDKAGVLWASTYEGVFILSGNRFIPVKPENDDKKVCIRRLFPGPGNAIYAATTNKGIYLIKNNEWEKISHPTDRSANSVYAILTDSRGKMWVGAKGGLYTANEERLEKFVKNGFRVNRSIYFIVEDRQNRLWIGTDNGVIKWDGKRGKEYTIKQGMMGRETNRAAGFVDRRGRVWIGTDRGLSCYREEFEKKDVPPPIVELGLFDASGEQFHLHEPNKLQLMINNLVFRFKVISFVNEDAIHFQTKLEGFDEDWSPEKLSNNREIRYTNLPSGRYRFHLKARNSEGTWSEPVSSEEIILHQPVWKSWWFILAFSFILGFALYSILANLSKKRYSALLEKQVQSKTKELQKSEQEYHGLFERAHDAIIIFDPKDERVLDVNQRACDIYGLSKEEFINMSMVSVTKDIEAGKQKIKSTLEKGVYQGFETTQLLKDGTPLYLEINASVVDFKGQTAILSINHDITARKSAEKELRRAHDNLEKRVGERTKELANANEKLHAKFREHRKTEEALRRSEKKYRGLFENILEGVYQTKPDGRILAANPALVQMLGFVSEEEFVTAANARKLYANREKRDILTRKLETEGELRNVEFDLTCKDGRVIRVMENARVVREKQGHISHYEGVLTDITQHKEAEEQIKAALKEKEVLLKEIHHRVKNNLQIIVSLLNLQSGYIEDKHAGQVFKNSQERVRAMALVHEKLYESKDLAKIDFLDYIESLVSSLLISYALQPEKVKLKLEIANIALDIDTSIPLGLIINELVANALKYAFKNRDKGELLVRLGENKVDGKEYNYTLIISDDGVGLPGDLDFRTSNTLGMLLVTSLAKQLHGAIELDRKGGTTFTLKFKKSITASPWTKEPGE